MSRLRPISSPPLKPPPPKDERSTDSRLDARLLLKPLASTSTQESRERRSTLPSLRTTKPERWRTLVLDIENRPLSYWYDGATTAEVTVIAYKWLGASKTKVLLAEGRDGDVRQMLDAFRPVYDKADVVLGHNVRRHDLALLAGAFVEQGLPTLEPKMTIDTLRDLTRWKDIPRSLEYMADWLGCPYQKFTMSQHAWREANRFTADGLALARKRCAVDVRVTEWCYRELVRRGLLARPPRMWSP